MRPARRPLPTSKLTDANNLEKLGLAFQRKAVQDFQIQQAKAARKQQIPASEDEDEDAIQIPSA